MSGGQSSRAPGSRITITQIGIVVADLDRSVRAYHDAFGWGPWQIYRLVPPLHTKVKLHGEAVESGIRIAIARAGPIDIELIEPLDGPSQHREALDAFGSGLNHILVRQLEEDGGEVEPDWSAMGLSELMSGRVEGVGSYVYCEGEDLGTIVEFASGRVVGSGFEPEEIYPPPPAAESSPRPTAR